MITKGENANQGFDRLLHTSKLSIISAQQAHSLPLVSLTRVLVQTFSSLSSRVSLSLVHMLGMSRYMNRWNRCSTCFFYRNRQDAIEALDIAARGKVKVYYQLKKLADLKE